MYLQYSSEYIYKYLSYYYDFVCEKLYDNQDEKYDEFVIIG